MCILFLILVRYKRHNASTFLINTVGHPAITVDVMIQILSMVVINKYLINIYVMIYTMLYFFLPKHLHHLVPIQKP